MSSTKEILAMIEKLGAMVCCYTLPEKPWASKCDCKYLNVGLAPINSGEHTGCCELREIRQALQTQIRQDHSNHHSEPPEVGPVDDYFKVARRDLKDGDWKVMHTGEKTFIAMDNFSRLRKKG